MSSILLRIWQAVLSMGSKIQSLLLLGQANATTLDKLGKAVQAVQADQQRILDLLAQIIDMLTPGPADHIVITAILDDGTILEGVTSMDMRDDQKVTLTIQIVDKKGKPAVVDGVPVWASSDETVVTVVAAADGMSAVASGVAPGAARVVVTADADLGAGVTDLTGTLDFNITPGSAATLSITAGAPEDQ